jgi:parvulin-like peptidyl-prolyl isomerase
MTVRVRPVDRGRFGSDPNRRTLWMNVGFGLAVIIAVLILVVVAATTWYGDHLAAAATIDGQTITKDQFADRANVEAFRLQQQINQVQSEVAAGRLTQTQADTKVQALNNQMDTSTFVSNVLEKIIDSTIQSKLAAQMGVAPTDQQINDAITKDKTRKEERHVLLIAVEPQITSGATTSTAVQIADAKKAADDALAQVKSGKAFGDVAKAVSTDASKTGGGDIGWIDQDASEDKDWVAAVFKLDVNGVTDVVKGADGTYRIGKVTEIAPAEVDAAWDQKLANAKISQPSYRAAIASEVLRQDLEDKIVADDSKSGPQRQVQELLLTAPTGPLGAKAIKVRHILYTPDKKDSAGPATVPLTDAGWTVAQLAAQKAYNTIVADPSKFDSIARAESNEASARGPDGTGGKLPFFDENSEANGLDSAFAKAILADGLQPGQVLPPFKSAYGWHVVQVMYRPPDSDEMTKLRAQAIAGTKFEDLVRDFSDGPHSGSGGNLGWVANGQLDQRLTDAIMKAPVGGLSDVVDIPDDGLYLFKVVAERTAVPDADQLATIKSSGFNHWYTAEKAAFKITRDLIPSASQ